MKFGDSKIMSHLSSSKKLSRILPRLLGIKSDKFMYRNIKKLN